LFARSLLKKFVFGFLSAFPQDHWRVRPHSPKFGSAENEIPKSRLGLLVFGIAVTMINAGHRAFWENAEQRAASTAKTHALAVRAQINEKSCVHAATASVACFPLHSVFLRAFLSTLRRSLTAASLVSLLCSF